VGHESSHVVERSYFHRSQLSWNGLLLLCLHNNTRLPKAATVIGVYTTKQGQATEINPSILGTTQQVLQYILCKYILVKLIV